MICRHCRCRCRRRRRDGDDGGGGGGGGGVGNNKRMIFIIVHLTRLLCDLLPSLSHSVGRSQS